MSCKERSVAGPERYDWGSFHQRPLALMSVRHASVLLRNFQGSVLASSHFEQMKDRYYALRGWDVATGVPSRETLDQYGLGYVVRELEKRGKLP